MARPPLLACNLGALSETERARRAWLLECVRRHARAVEPTETGFRIELTIDERDCEALVELAGLERRCCPFLTLDLVLEDDRVLLQLSGPPGVKEFLQQSGLIG